LSGLFANQDGHPKSAEWYTPKWVFDELGIEFDLDPASPETEQTAVPAKRKYTPSDDGLSKPWFGRVWLNPPYCHQTETWMRRMTEHANGIALVFSRTDSKWCQLAMKTADAYLFLAGRISFIPGEENRHKRSRAGAGTVMFAWGEECALALFRMKDRGVFLRPVR
jgi:hypothetical protein